ncbi:MAG: hypothetical protein A2V67_08435 [Deltaproteobacteria bacterium RBG_13_61_14]|nr:MAG: hypothetical protein A2V67_08435 [Deltaproteobacteria bacterium RBG_13_61_14]
MTKQDHIQYWMELAEHDWETCESLFATGRYDSCLFYAHLLLEKLLKALWVKSHAENVPPKIHPLHLLALDINLELPQETLTYLKQVNRFAIESRYPDYKMSFYRECTREFTEANLKRIQETATWLKEKLKS